jgi:hypothetical protein
MRNPGRHANGATPFPVWNQDTTIVTFGSLFSASARLSQIVNSIAVRGIRSLGR